MTGTSAARVAHRDRLVAEHMQTKPPWWRFFARRAWKRRLASLLAMDVSQMTELFAALYPPSYIADLANRPSFYYMLKRSKERPSS